MTDLASESWPGELALFLALVLAQCTFVTAIALLVARALRQSAALRQTALRTGMASALICPLATLGLQMANVRLISIPIPVKEVLVVQNPVLTPNRPREAPHPSVTATPETVSLPHPQMNHMEEIGSAQLVEDSKPIWRGPLYLVLWIWAIGLLASGYGICRGSLKVRRLLRNTRSPPGDWVLAEIRRTQADLAISHFPAVVCSGEVKSPVVAGILHPVIILPDGLCKRMSAVELRMVLLHEVAHILQYDHMSLLMERLLAAIYWFHPLAHCLVRELARAHEEVCDNYVLQFVDGPRYGETLLRLTRLLQHLSPVPGSVGLFSLRWKLEERISGLLDERRETMVRTGFFSRSVIVVLSSLVILAIGATRPTSRQDAARTENVVSNSTTNKPSNGPSQQLETVATVDGNHTDLQLIQQECKRRGVEVTEQDVRDEIKRLATQYGVSVDDWLAMLQEERGVDPDSYSNDVIWPTVALRNLARDLVVVTEDDIEKAFECNYGPRVKIRVIVCRDRRRADEIHARVKSDPTVFGKVAREESIDAHSAAADGLVPPIRRHAGSPDVERTAFALKPGEISDIVNLNGNYLILQCERHIGRKNAILTAEIRTDLERALRQKGQRHMSGQILKQLRQRGNP